jgi:hypothetical protein
MFKINWKVLILTVIIGVCIVIATGIPGNKFFGWPLVWRISEMETGTEICSYFELFVDCIFWIVIALVIFLFAKITKS